MTNDDRRPASGKQQPQPGPTAGQTRAGSSNPAGAARAGRRETERRRREEPKSAMQRFRTPILAAIVIVVLVGVGLVVFASAAAPAYACTSVDSVLPAPSGELGQVQADMGNQHVASGDKVTYPVCPPASGKHLNHEDFGAASQQKNGPIKPRVYVASDQVGPNNWIHNLEHGGLVLLYSCAKGACDANSTSAFQAFYDGFPASTICHLAPGQVGPVIAPFDQMPTKYAALIWDRALYLDTLDTQKIYDFFLRYDERIAGDGTWIAPPEAQCVAPTRAPATPVSPAPSASGG